MDERRQGYAELTERLVRLEMQVGRLVSDAESEKDTRRRVSEAINHRFVVSEDRVRSLERTIWMASGAVAVIVLIVNLILKHL